MKLAQFTHFKYLLDEMEKSFFRQASCLLFQNCSVSSRRASENAKQVSEECQNWDKRRAEEAKFEQSPFPLTILLEQSR